MHYLTKTGVLSRRGWSQRLIADLLSEPDEVRPNPYGGVAPMQLFSRRRVERAERSPGFRRPRITIVSGNNVWTTKLPDGVAVTV